MTTSNPQVGAYAGDISPADAWALVQAGEALLVDVRTPEEHKWVGRVPGAIPVPWLIDNGQRQNPDFLAQLAQVTKPDQKVVLLCRSGVRSVAAATAGAQAGFTNLWNIVGGFEGRLDEKRQRNHVEGWRFSGLPWEQS